MSFNYLTSYLFFPFSPSPSSKLGLSSVERLNSMSPAAQRLASKRLGIKTSSDKALLASYNTPSPSPTHRLPGTKTPTRLTPGSRRSHGSLPGSPAVSTPSSERGDATPSNSDLSSLTDHLLKLPQRKRKRAADFFEQQWRQEPSGNDWFIQRQINWLHSRELHCGSISSCWLIWIKI